MNTNADDKHGGGAVEGAMTVLSIPDDMVQKVLDFVESLQPVSDDVSGYMLSGGLAGRFGGTLAATETSHTGITTFQTGAEGTDLKWSDTDTITTSA